MDIVVYALFLADQGRALKLQPVLAEKSRILRRKTEEYKAASIESKNRIKIACQLRV
ncbi:hypothetical protein LJC19_03960 [Oxalobacter sp. OttesenSCG-928-P03]|nr:hypothetical protein [Oxalobacter sp. OttesenSCG-928-P03]